MKKVLLIVGLVLFFSSHVFGSKLEDWRKQSGYYEGDPNQNIILEQGDDYIVLRNLTAKNKIPVILEGKTLWHEPAEVFIKEGEKFCEKHSKYNFLASIDNLVTFDDNTILIGCSTSLSKLFDENFKNPSMKLKGAIAQYEICFISKEDGDNDFFKSNKCKKFMKIVDKEWPEAKILVLEIEKQRDKYIDNPSIVNDIRKRFDEKILKEKQEALLASVESKRELCFNMGFEDGTEPLANCVLQLMLSENEQKEKQLVVVSNDSSGIAQQNSIMDEQTRIMEKQLRLQKIEANRENMRRAQYMMKYGKIPMF